jgi:hypothetical protein
MTPVFGALTPSGSLAWYGRRRWINLDLIARSEYCNLHLTCSPQNGVGYGWPLSPSFGEHIGYGPRIPTATGASEGGWQLGASTFSEAEAPATCRRNSDVFGHVLYWVS